MLGLTALSPNGKCLDCSEPQGAWARRPLPTGPSPGSRFVHLHSAFTGTFQPRVWLEVLGRGVFCFEIKTQALILHKTGRSPSALGADQPGVVQNEEKGIWVSATK